MAEKITVDFHLDDDGKVIDATPHGQAKGAKDDPHPPHAWASAIIATKHSPGCVYIWTPTGWKKVCT